MVSRLYHRYSQYLLIVLAGLSLPLATLAHTLPNDNHLETWLPRDAEVIARYEQFKAEFGNGEFVFVALDGYAPDHPLLEGLAKRFERLPHVERCWTPARMKRVMTGLGVAPDEADRRILGLLASADGNLAAVHAVLSAEGVRDRAQAMAAIHAELRTCGLTGDRVHLAGPPVVSAALDYWGSLESVRFRFLGTLAICFVLVGTSLGNWTLAGAILLLCIGGVELSQAVVHLAGGQMNFILTALAPMVLVLSLAMSVHVVHYYRWCRGEADAIAATLRMAWRPCFLACVTTAIGMASLAVSDIGPVYQFGLAAAAGAFVALFVGLGVVPAVLVVLPDRRPVCRPENGFLLRRISSALRYRRTILAVSLAALAIGGWGLSRLRSEINPLQFLPPSSKVSRDYVVLEEELNGMAPIEAVVDFGDEPSSFSERLARVRKLEQQIAAHPSVRGTLSLARFFPEEQPKRGLWGLLSLGKVALADPTQNSYLAQDGRLWRITAWVPARGRWEFGPLLDELRTRTAGEPISFTGVVPLLHFAQDEIFHGFWESFLLALGVIAAVMTIGLRSVGFAAIALVPNVAPVVLVFGLLAWADVPVDIGTMMTASIALGFAVDNKLHFLGCFRRHRHSGITNAEAVQRTLEQCARPIAKTAMIAGLGLLVLVLSHFEPTVRFGWLMALLLAAALLGDLILLPALLLTFFRTPTGRMQHDARRRPPVPAPAFAAQKGIRRGVPLPDKDAIMDR
jgi:predicted RND superfamily exporter protein